MWGIWLERNAVIFRGSVPSGASVMSSINRTYIDNSIAFMNIAGRSRSPGSEHHMSSPPARRAPARFWSVICDGAVDSLTGSVFGAAILVDDNNKVFAASVHTLNGSDPLLAEGLACRAGLLLAALSPEVPRVLLTDSLQLYNLLMTSSSSSLPLFGILEDIRHLLLCNLTACLSISIRPSP